MTELRSRSLTSRSVKRSDRSGSLCDNDDDDDDDDNGGDDDDDGDDDEEKNTTKCCCPIDGVLRLPIVLIGRLPTIADYIMVMIVIVKMMIAIFMMMLVIFMIMIAIL